VGNDDPRLRRHWLDGVSSEVKASIDGRLIQHHRVCILRAAFGRLFLFAKGPDSYEAEVRDVFRDVLSGLPCGDGIGGGSVGGDLALSQ
jgi:hypothetical protein